LVDATLTPLRATRNGGPQYVETAAVWLQEGLSVAATARALQVHERTIRYRLARIAKLTALDLQHADDRFRLELALRGDRLLAATPPA
ncbi:MAG: PucR family transcriptional regulator, partial [Gaiellales bacterium]